MVRARAPALPPSPPLHVSHEGRLCLRRCPLACCRRAGAPDDGLLRRLFALWRDGRRKMDLERRMCAAASQAAPRCRSGAHVTRARSSADFFALQGIYDPDGVYMTFDAEFPSGSDWAPGWTDVGSGHTLPPSRDPFDINPAQQEAWNTELRRCLLYTSPSPRDAHES
eukprot:2546452-Prymnesium_polylepis.1